MAGKLRVMMLPWPLLALACAAAFAGAEPDMAGWTEAPVKFHVQSPYNLPQSDRYTVSNGVYHLRVLNHDAAFASGNTTKPRTEQRFDPDYTSRQIQYAADLMVPAGTSNVCVMQIHTGNADSPRYGATTFMLFIKSDNGGSLHFYSGEQILATNLYDKWFHLVVRHDLNTHLIEAWIDGRQVFTKKDNGAPDFYMKDGVYTQTGASPEMEVYIKNIQFWTHP
jgi:hypothetical protein